MRVGRLLTLLAVGVLASACYRQVIQTGRTPGPTVIHRPWTSTFLWGLVAPAPINVSQQCPSGIATVQTQMSVPNALAGLITLGIYSPRDVTVTCATASSMPSSGLKEFYVSRDASPSERDRVFLDAVEASQRLDAPVVVRF